MTLDLTNFAVTADTILGLADLKFQYQLELRDSQGALLPLAGIQVAEFNNTYDGSGLIADAGCFLLSDVCGHVLPGRFDLCDGE
jgi:hypothetical protein